MSISQNPLTGEMKNSMANFITTTCGDKNVIRAKAFNPRNANTSSQKIQRACFKLILEEYHSLGGITKVGFPEKTVNKSSYNLFVQANLPGAVNTTGALPVIDYSKLQVAKGSLPNVVVASATTTATGINVSYRTNLQIPMVAATDEVVAFAKTKIGEMLIARQPRGIIAMNTILISSPGIAPDDVECCYVFVLSNDGKKASKSVYTVID